ncbi:MAG: hypothetical protein ACOYEC_05620 [Christensenellales bacterium]|jgi:hypothetical protein|nr:hypothetical protein [Clostridiales bacterium]
MNKKTVLIIIALLAIAAITVGCTENYKQNPIGGNYDNKEIFSNGGMAVKYGDYLYFINGYAAKDDKNNFGDVVKGAIMRVELDDNGKPKLSTLVTVVPKKVYSTDKEYGGLFIVNDYIYYSTTSMEKDSEGNPKTDKMVIMRTKVNGADTEIIAEFDSHSIKYKVINNSLVYVKDNNIYRINLTDKKFAAKKVDEGIDSTFFYTRPLKDSNSMDNYIFYSKTDSQTGKKTIKVAAIEGDFKKDIFTSDDMGDDAIYTATIIDIKYYEEKITVFYNITDNKPTTPSAGIYSYTYDTNFNFIKSNLIRYTNNPTSTEGFGYSKFYYLEGKVLAFGSGKNESDQTVSKMDIFSLTGDKEGNAVTFNGTVVIEDIFFEEGENQGYYIYYSEGNKYYKMKLFDMVDGSIQPAGGNASLYYDGAFTSTWIKSEVIDNVLYFFNADVSDNIFYLDLDAVKERDAESRKPRVLGVITDEDRIAAF